MIKIGNAPCSWGVEFADDPRNPDWRHVLKENAEAGFTGIELGPVGFMPEDPAVLAEALAEYNQELIGGVIFRAFHDPEAWEDVIGRLDPHLQSPCGPWRDAVGYHRQHLAAPCPHSRPRR